MSESLDQKLIALKWGAHLADLPQLDEQAVQSNLGYAECLEQLLTEELPAR